MMMQTSQVFKGKTFVWGVNLGCGAGGTCYRGYINVDTWRSKYEEGWKQKRGFVFLIADATRLPLQDNVLDEVYCSHLLEHFNCNFTSKILAEWHRVLKPNGIIKICVPSMDWVVDLWLGNKRWQEYDQAKGMVLKKDGKAVGSHGPIIRNLYGHIPEDDSQSVGHKYIFDFESLKYYLEGVGFRNVRPAKIHCVVYWSIGQSEVCVVADK